MIQKKHILKSFKPVLQDTEQNQALIARLMDFGLYPGIEFEVIKSIPFSKVTVIQFCQTLLALNEQEFQCLEI